MKNVTYKIIETRSGEFVLLLHNHSQKLITEKCRSKNLDGVVERLKKKKNINQSAQESKSKNNTEKPFDPVEFFEKRLKKAGIKYRIMKPPKNSCWDIYNR